MAADITKIAKVEEGIKTLTSGENSLEKLNLSTLDKQTGSVMDRFDIQKIATVQSTVSRLTGAPEINLGGVASIADCLKNIDDIIIEKLKQKALNTLLATTSAQTLVAALGTMLAYAELGAQLYQKIEELREKSLLELLLMAKDAGYLDRIGIIKTISDKYGAAVTGLNDMIANLASLDICSMPNYRGGERLSPASPISGAPPVALPVFLPALTLDEPRVQTQNQYNDTCYRIGDVIGKGGDFADGAERESALVSMLPELQFFSRMAINRFTFEADTATIEKELLAEISHKVETYREQWSALVLKEYEQRAKKCVEICVSESQTLREYGRLKTTGELV